MSDVNDNLNLSASCSQKNERACDANCRCRNDALTGQSCGVCCFEACNEPTEAADNTMKSVVTLWSGALRRMADSLGDYEGMVRIVVHNSDISPEETSKEEPSAEDTRKERVVAASEIHETKAVDQATSTDNVHTGADVEDGQGAPQIPIAASAPRCSAPTVSNTEDDLKRAKEVLQAQMVRTTELLRNCCLQLRPRAPARRVRGNASSSGTSAWSSRSRRNSSRRRNTRSPLRGTRRQRKQRTMDRGGERGRRMGRNSHSRCVPSSDSGTSAATCKSRPRSKAERREIALARTLRQWAEEICKNKRKGQRGRRSRSKSVAPLVQMEKNAVLSATQYDDRDTGLRRSSRLSRSSSSEKPADTEALLDATMSVLTQMVYEYNIAEGSEMCSMKTLKNWAKRNSMRNKSADVKSDAGRSTSAEPDWRLVDAKKRQWLERYTARSRSSSIPRARVRRATTGARCNEADQNAVLHCAMGILTQALALYDIVRFHEQEQERDFSTSTAAEIPLATRRPASDTDGSSEQRPVRRNAAIQARRQMRRRPSKRASKSLFSK